jgi:hypothetical protein
LRNTTSGSSDHRSLREFISLVLPSSSIIIGTRREVRVT